VSINPESFSKRRLDTVEFAGAATRSLSVGINRTRFGGNLNSEAQTTGEWFFDDVLINSNSGSFQNSYPGPGSIKHLKPNAAGDNSAWSNDYQSVDEVTPDDATTFCASNTLDQIDDHELEASGLTNESISFVVVGYRANRTGGTTPNPTFVLRIKASSGGTVEESSAITPDTAWAVAASNKLILYDLPGASSTAWTPADLDTAQIGYRLSNSPGTRTAQVSTVWLLVRYVAPAVLSPSAIASAEAFGTAKLNQAISCTGIASAEAFGTTKLNQSITASGIASTETFGTPTVSIGAQSIIASGIASAEAFGTAQLNQKINGAGITSTEAFGTAQLNQKVVAAGIASSEAFGTPAVQRSIGPTGIVSSETFGAAKLNQNLTTTGIPSGAAFGTATLNRSIQCNSISSTEAFGTPSVNRTISVTGIASAEAFGTASVTRTLRPTGITSSEAFGLAQLNRSINLSGIPSAEAFGTTEVRPILAGILFEANSRNRDFNVGVRSREFIVKKRGE